MNSQAFHWCPDYDKAAREFARILKPDGIVALIWNLEDRYVIFLCSSFEYYVSLEFRDHNI